MDDVEAAAAVMAHVGREMRQRIDSAHMEWLKQLVGLSAAALTLLVSLQSSYVGANPRAGWLLSVCWGCLCSATLLGLLALFGEAQSQRELLLAMREQAQQAIRNPGGLPLSTAIANRIRSTPDTARKRFDMCSTAGGSAFAIAMATLTLFAILNRKG